MNPLKTALKVFVFFTLLTGLAYPLLITGIAQLAMPNLANGSLLQNKEELIGSLLLSQNTTDTRYFWPRPSAIGYDPLKPSGGSNLGPTSQRLKEAVEARKQKMGSGAPAEMLYASGSGLDPHISIETAYFQIPRVSKARGVPDAHLKELVDSLSEGKQLGFLGARYVNVLLLNQAMDKSK